MEHFHQLAAEDRSGRRAYEYLYMTALQFARHATGFVIDDEGKLNRPNEFAQVLNSVGTKRPDVGMYAATLGVVAAVLFPYSLEEMGKAQRMELAAFTRRYVPQSSVNGPVFMAVFRDVRSELVPLLRGIKPVLYKDGAPVFLPSSDPFVCRVQCDLALLYQMAFRVDQHQDEMQAMFSFVHRMLNKMDEGVESMIFSRGVLEQFVLTHFLGYAQGEPTLFMSRTVHRGLTYRLYLNGAFDAFFRAGQLSEQELCRNVAHCTPREPDMPPRRVLIATTPIRQPPQNLDRTAVDPFLVDAVLDLSNKR